MGPFGINLVAVAPGRVDTETCRTKYPPQFRDHVAASTVARRLVTPEEIAATALPAA